jgi:hypothetical protein
MIFEYTSIMAYALISYGRKIVSLLTCSLLGAQCLLAYQPENSFWANRQRHVQEQSRFYARATPAGETVGARGVADQFPRIEIPNESITSSKIRHVPDHLLEGNEKLFSALTSNHGQIRKVSVAQGETLRSPLVIHIQDVHRNAEAQWNIREVVSDLLSSGQVNLLALEGATEKISLQHYAEFPFPHAVKRGADYLLRENEISGPIHAALTTESPLPPIVGIDDPLLYAANVQAYREATLQGTPSRQNFNAIQQDLNNQKKSVYSPALLAFDQTVNGYRVGEIGLGTYVQSLMPQPGRSAPLTHLFLQATALERDLNFDQVEKERGLLVKALTQRLNPQETNILISDSLAYRAGRLGYADFYGRLLKTCERVGVPLSRYPAMDAYVRYVLLAEGIDPEGLQKELHALEKATFSRLSQREEERSLINKSRQIWLTQKLLDFSLTPLDWAEYNEMNQQDNNLKLKPFESFYLEAHKRDLAMGRRLLTEIKGSSVSRPVVVLVTGGYHAEGMAKFLTREGITVVSYVPKIEKIDTREGSVSLSVFTQEKTPLEKLFQGESLFLAQSPWKKTVRTALAPAVVSLPLRLDEDIDPKIDCSNLYSSLGGEGVLSHVTGDRGTVRAVLSARLGKLFVTLTGTAESISSVEWSEFVEKRTSWVSSVWGRFVGFVQGERADLMEPRSQGEWRVSLLQSLVGFVERALDLFLHKFGFPLSYLRPGVVPESGSSTAIPLDPMNFRHLPRKEILDVLRKDLNENYPWHNEHDSIRVQWPPWYDTDQKEKEFPVPEIIVQLKDNRKVSYFVKPANFQLPAQIGLEMQRMLGIKTISMWSVPRYIVLSDAGLDTTTVFGILNKLWLEAKRTGDLEAQGILQNYMGQMNSEIGRLLATEVILGYPDGVGQNVVFRNTRDLKSILAGPVPNDFSNAIQWIKNHPPELNLFDFGAHEFLKVFLLEHYWEPGGVDYMVLNAKAAFDDLLRLSMEMGALDETEVRKAFLDQMNLGYTLEDDFIDYLEKTVPHETAALYFAEGFETSIQDRLDDDFVEWYQTLVADTVLSGHTPTFPLIGQGGKKALRDLSDRLASGKVNRTANVFDMHGNPKVLERLIPLVEARLIDEVIVHGDVFDRGNNNKGCYAAMRTLKEKLGDRFILILGNHEILMIESLILMNEKSLPIWLANGGNEVFREFGVLHEAEGIVNKILNLDPLSDLALHARNGFRWSFFYRYVKSTILKMTRLGAHHVINYDYELFLNDTKTRPLIEMAWWVLGNSRFHYIDDKGWVHLHAGMPLTLSKKPMFTAVDLAAAENRMATILRRARVPYDLTVHHREALLGLFHQFSGIFWVRKSLWIYRFFNPALAQKTYYPTTLSAEEEGKLRAKANVIAQVTGGDPEGTYKMFLKKLSKPEDRLFIVHLGVLAWSWFESILQNISHLAQGILIGHNLVPILHNVGNMFFDADTGRADFILMGPDGIQFVSEKVDLLNGGVPQTLSTREQMVDRVNARVRSLEEGLPQSENTIGDSRSERDPLSLGYLLSGDWRWGGVGLFLEWAGGVFLAHLFVAEFSAEVLGFIPPVIAAMGVFAVVLYAYSFVHALVIAGRDDQEPHRGPPRSLSVRANEFFKDFLPYLVLPGVFLLAPGWGDLTALAVLGGHVYRDFRSKMGDDFLRSFQRVRPSNVPSSPGASTEETLLNLMPDAKKGTYSAEDIFGTIVTPSADLEQVARGILDKSTPEERKNMSSLAGATDGLLQRMGIDQRSVGLIPLSPEVLATPNPQEWMSHTLAIHRQTVFYVEKNTTIPQMFSETIQTMNDRVLLIRLDEGVHLFEGRNLLMATLERHVPPQFPIVQPYLPPGYSANDSGVKDSFRFGKESVRPMGLLIHFERFLELARLIAQQA